MVAGAFNQKERQYPHQQVLRLWAMLGRLFTINLVLHVNGLLANLEISNYLIEQMKMTLK